MAHFAEINKADNKVLRVIVISNERVNSLGGDLSVAAEEWVKNNVPQDDLIKQNNNGIYPEVYWKQTSYNSNFRKNFAAKGSKYDLENDVFYGNQPYPEYVLNRTTWLYEPPTPWPPYPNNDTSFYMVWVRPEYLKDGNGYIAYGKDSNGQNVEYKYNEVDKIWEIKNA